MNLKDWREKNKNEPSWKSDVHELIKEAKSGNVEAQEIVYGIERAVRDFLELSDVEWRALLRRASQSEIHDAPVLSALLKGSTAVPREVLKEIIKEEIEKKLVKPITFPPDTMPKWRGNGEPPDTKAAKIAAIEAWDAIPKDERPKLEKWLIESFGRDPATEEPRVLEVTFHGWRRFKKS